MALKELMDSRKVSFKVGGMTGIRQWNVPWEDRYEDTPDIGDAYPDEPGLSLSTLEFSPLSGTKPDGSGEGFITAKVTGNYTSRDVDPFEATIEFSSQALETADGRMWEGGKYNAVGQSDAILYPQAEFAHKVYVDEIPWATIFAAMSTVNESKMEMFGFKFPPESLLFLGGTAQEEFTGRRKTVKGDLVFRYLMSYNFLFKKTGPVEDGKKIGHNVIWRSGLQKVDASGNPVFNANSTPVMADGIVGQSGWDQTDPLLYELYDLESLL